MSCPIQTDKEKLIKKRVETRIVKKYNTPRASFQRLLKNKEFSAKEKEKLKF
ncbi:MAG: hypothetical protein WCK16_03925 [Candidatus Moraniibacteriota bacterium]